MGQKHTKDKQKQKDIEKQVQLNFKDEEIIQAKLVYEGLLNDKKNLDLELFSKLFENDLEFGVRLYKYMMKNKKTFTFTDYLLLIQTFSKEANSKIPINLFKANNLTKLQIFSLILLEQYENHDINKVMLSQQDVENILYHLIMIYDIDNLQLIMESLKKRVSPFFDESSEQFLAYNNKRINLREATAIITKIFTSINQIVSIYFQNKLLHKQIYIQVPNMNVQSIIMTDDFLCLLYMNNLYYQASHNLTLLHQSSMDGMSLQTIINNLLGYDSQTIIVVRSNLGIFGIFNNQPWLSQKEAQGDDNCFIFSFQPTFNIFTANNQSQNKNFAYMNSKSIKDYDKYQAGIGYGMSKDGSKYRLWLDQLIHSQSYIMFSDDIYEPGWILEPKEYTKRDSKVFLNIDAIEIWGLGNDENFQNQIQRKLRNNNHSMRARIINKKIMFSLLSEFDKQIFFSSTFQHVSQIREDLCCPAEMVEEQHRLNRQQINNVSPLRANEES
ncbi:hypothetical protein ABPG74_021639 [Tetrahymena malaccensis]